MKPVNRMLKDEIIKSIEEKYKAKYLIDTCLKNISGDWVDFPAAIFYTEEKHPSGSNYMALYHSDIHDGWMVTDGFNAVQGLFEGFLFDDGELVHSRYRHDYFEHREAMVDGGRTYFRSRSVVDGARRIQFEIVDGQIVEVNDAIVA